MFYTVGWGAILGVGGTVAGVIITQAANSALSWRITRKERKASITKAVGELIGSGASWVYATCAQEQDLFHAVATNKPEEQLMDTLKSARAGLYAAQLEFNRAMAEVRLTCPSKIVDAAEDFREAIQAIDAQSREKGGAALERRSVNGIEATDVLGVVRPQSRLVAATRKATGYGPSV